MFPTGKNGILSHSKFCAYCRIVDLRKGPEYLYWLFDVLPKQTTCEMKTLQVLAYIQQ